jgi:hypothetical protein
MAACQGEILNRRHGRISAAKAAFGKPGVIGLRAKYGRGQQHGGGQKEQRTTVEHQFLSSGAGAPFRGEAAGPI